MRKLLLLLLFFILIQGVIATGDKVFSDWVYNKNTVTLDNKNFYFQLASQGNSLLVKSGDNQIILSLGSCKNFDEKRQICFNESFYDLPNDPANKAYVNVYYKKPRLNISRTIDDNILLVGEEATFTVSLYNFGEVTAYNVYYIDNFPENVIVKSSSGCPSTERGVYYKGDVVKGSSVSCKYTIKTTKPVDATTISSITYDNGFKTVTNYSSSIRIYSSPVLRVNASIGNATIQINGKTNFYINLTNDGTLTIDIEELKIKVPSGLNVTFNSIAKEDKSTYKWSGSLTTGATQGILLKIEGLRTRSSEILTNVKYKIGTDYYNITNIKSNVLVEDKGITLDSSVVDNERVDANTQKIISITVLNKNNYTDLKNLVLSLNSTLFPSGIYNLSTLGEGAREKIGAVTIITPAVKTTTSYKIYANVTYETLYGDIGSEKLERTLVVEPVNKLVITKTLNPSEIEEKKEATMTVSVTNERNVRVENVDIKEIFPAEIKQRGTTITRIENISKGDTFTAYTYTVIAPDVINETYYNITTEASYEKDGQTYTFTKDIIFKVKPKKLKITVSKTVSDTEIYKGEIINVRYTIKNDEEDPAKNLRLKFADNDKFDTINEYEFTLGRLEPDEIVVVEKEQIRPKESGSNIVLDGSILYFQDMNGVQYNTTSDSLTLRVEDTYMQRAAILIEKSSNLHELKRADEVDITIVVKNVGDEDASVLIVDDSRTWNKTINAGQEKIISYKTRFYEPGEYTLPKVYAYYNILGNEYRAVSNTIKLKVTEPIIEKEEPEEVAEEPEIEEEEIVEEPVEKVSFFVRMWRLILGIFS